MHAATNFRSENNTTNNLSGMSITIQQLTVSTLIDPEIIFAFKDKEVKSSNDIREAVIYFNKVSEQCDSLHHQLLSGTLSSGNGLEFVLAKSVISLAIFQADIYHAIDFDNFEGAQPLEEIRNNIRNYKEMAESYKEFIDPTLTQEAEEALYALDKTYKVMCIVHKLEGYEKYRDEYAFEALNFYKNNLYIEKECEAKRIHNIQTSEAFDKAFNRFKKVCTFYFDFQAYISHYDLDIDPRNFTDILLLNIEIMYMLKKELQSLKKAALTLGKSEVEDEIQKYISGLYKIVLIIDVGFTNQDLKKMQEIGKGGFVTKLKTLKKDLANMSNKPLETKTPKIKKEISEEERNKIAEANQKLMAVKIAPKEEEKVDTKSKIISSYPQFAAILKEVNESDPKKVILTFESTVKDINNIKTIFSDRSVKGVKVTRLNQTKLTLEFNRNQLENTLLNNTSVKSKISAAIKLPAPQPEQPKPVVTKPQETNQDNSQEPEKSVDTKPQETDQNNSPEPEKTVVNKPQETNQNQSMEQSKGNNVPTKKDFDLTEKEVEDWVTPLAKMLGLSKEDIHWMPADQTEKAHFKIKLTIGKQLKFGETKLILSESDKADLLSRIDKYFIKHDIAKLTIDDDKITVIPLSQRPGNVSLLQEQINSQFCEEKTSAASKPITLFQPKAEEKKTMKSKIINPKELRKQQDIANIMSFLSVVTNCDLANKSGLLKCFAIGNGVFTFNCKMVSISTNNPDEPPHETGEFFSKLAKVINTNIGEEVVTFAAKKLTIDNNHLNELVKKQALIKAEFESIAKATYTPVGKLEEAPVPNKSNIDEAAEKLAEKIKTVFCKINTEEELKIGFLSYLHMITTVDYAALTDDQKYAAFMPWAFVIVNTLSNIAEEKDSIDKPLLYELRNILRHGIHDVSVEEIEHIYLPFFRQLEKCFNYFTSKQITLWTDSEILNTVKREMTASTKALLDYNIKFKDGLNTYSLQITSDFVNRIESQMMSRVQQGKQLSVEEFLFFILIKGEGKNADAFYKSTYIEIGHGTSFKTLPKELLDNVYTAYSEEVYKRIRDNYTQTHTRHIM